MIYIVVFILGTLAGGFLIFYLKDQEFKKKINAKAGEFLDKAGKNMYPEHPKKPVKKTKKIAPKTNGVN